MYLSASLQRRSEESDQRSKSITRSFAKINKTKNTAHVQNLKRIYVNKLASTLYSRT
jgi:hypothetical protein